MTQNLLANVRAMVLTSRQRLWLALLLVPLAARMADAAAVLPQAPAVSVLAAERGVLVERVTLTGTYVAREEAMVVPQVDGLAITAVLAEEGDRVAAGQVLARLSRDAVDIALAQNAAQIAHADASVAAAQGQIAEASANRVEADAAFARTSALISRGDASHETYEQRQAGQAVAVARVNAAEDALALARADRALAGAEREELAVRLARCELRAPAAGLVSQREARLGAVVGTASGPLFRLVTDGLIELEASVPEALLAALHPGQAAQLIVDGRELPGRVRLIAPQVSQQSRLGRVRIAFDPPLPATMAPPPTGRFGRAVVEVDKRDGMLVPLSAVLFGADGAHVAVVMAGPDGPIARMRSVVVGLRDDSRAEIDSGVAAGEQVVALSGTFLRDGDRITPIAAAAVTSMAER